MPGAVPGPGMATSPFTGVKSGKAAIKAGRGQGRCRMELN